MITERLMKPGAWTLRLKDSTPLSVLRAIRVYDYLLITKGRLGSITGQSDASMLSASMYTGLMFNRQDRYSLEGAGWFYAAGADDGIGPKDPGFECVAASTASDVVPFLVNGTLHSSQVNVDNTGLTTFEQRIFPTGLTQREWLDGAALACGGEYRANPDLTLDFEHPDTLFTTTSPEVIVTRIDGGAEGSLRGLHGTDIVAGEDGRSYLSAVEIYDQGGSRQSVATSVTETFLGPATIGSPQPISRVRSVDAATEQPDQALVIAQKMAAAANSLSTRAIRLSSATYAVQREARPGDTIYVWDPDNDVTDSTNQIQYRGQTINPAALRVFGYTWPVEQGMGVYLRRPRLTAPFTWTTDYLDLSNWIEFETGDVTWEVGSTSKHVDTDPAHIGSTGRLGANPAVAERNQGAFDTTFDPTVDQGASTNIAHTLVLSEWRYDGPMIDWFFTITMTAGGTAGSAVNVDLPVPLVNSTARSIGGGLLYDNSTTTRYVVQCEPNGTSAIMFGADGTVSGNLWGATPNLPLESGDVLRISVRYRWI